MTRPSYDERCDAIASILDEALRRADAVGKTRAGSAELAAADLDAWRAELREVSRLTSIARKRMKRLPTQQQAA